MLQPKDTYIQNLTALKFGFPLFSPSNVQLGDIGFIDRSDGSFQLLYNVATPNIDLEGHPPALTLRSTKPDFTEWQGIHMRAKSSHKIDVSIQPPTAEGNARFQFGNIGQGDVILIPGNTVRKDTLREQGELKKYFETHLDWIAHTYCPKENILWNELILVVGTTKTNRWAIAVSVHEQAEASLAFVVRGSGVSAWGEWAGTVGFDKCSPHVDTPDDEPTQTIFINRIKPRGLLGKIQTTNEPNVIKRIWNGILK
jgi:hypothetical protein